MEKDPVALEFQHTVLKRYRYWTLLLNERQRYLGRAVVWLSREGDMQRFSKLSIPELIELQLICQEYEAVLNRIGWKPDHMNNSMLGNFFHEHKGHGHMHIIPRYAPLRGPITYLGVEFTDDRWGKNSSPETPFDIPIHVFQVMVAMLQIELAK